MKKTCIDLTIFEFILCSFRKDFTCLGGETDAENKQLWNAIYEEWAGLTNNGKYFELLDLFNEVIRYNDIILKTDIAITSLTYHYSKEQIDILKSLGYPVSFDRYDKSGWEKDIKTVSNRIKTIKIQLDMCVSKIKKMEKTDGKTESEQSFMESVAIISKYIGSAINIKTMTLYEYSSYLRLYTKESERANNG